MEKFSVLLSLYNKEKSLPLEQALSSIFNQSAMPAEVILVLDGPITEELQVVVNGFQDKYPEMLRVIPLKENVGLGVALSKGLKYCSYELIARMDTDDISKFDRFEKQLNVFKQHPELSVVGSWVDEFTDVPEDSKTQRKLPKTNDELVVFAKKRNPLNHPSVMFKKSDIKSVGSYQPFPLFEDYYLWARLICGGYQLFNIQESLLYFRSNPQMIVRRGGWRYAVSEIKFLRILYKLKLCGMGTFLRNVVVRFPIRVAPTKIRSYIYQKFLR